MKTSLLILLLTAAVVLGYCNRTTRTPDRTSADPPSSLTCGRCHFGATGGTAWITGLPEFGYVPGTTYDLQLHLYHSTKTSWGFQLIVKDASNTVRGTLAIADANTFVSSGGYLNQSYAGCFIGSTGEVVWNFHWTAPATDCGALTLHASCICADNRNNEGGDATVNIHQAIAVSSGIAEHGQTENFENVPVSVYDISGRIVAHGMLSEIKGNLGDGLYFARPDGGDNTAPARKIVVVH